MLRLDQSIRIYGKAIRKYPRLLLLKATLGAVSRAQLGLPPKRLKKKLR